MIARLAPVFILAAVLSAFMAADKLWLHWYTPEIPHRSAPSVAAGNRIESGVINPSITQAIGTATAPNHSMTPRPLPQSHDAFGALWIAGTRVTYRIRYETSSRSGDRGDNYIIFNMPPLARIDTVPPGGSAPSSQLVVRADGTTIACWSNPTGRSCAPIKPFDGTLPDAAGPIVFPALKTFSSLSITEISPRIEAGVSARCFQVTPGPLAQTPTEYCFTAVGVPVYANGPFGIVKATQLSAAVSASDFRIPGS